MHLHGLKFLIALIIIIGKVLIVTSHPDSSTKYIFDEVADFDDIVERDPYNVNFNKETSDADAPTSTEHGFSNSHTSSKVIPFIKSHLRPKSKIHDIKNRESNLFSSNQISGYGDMSDTNDALYQPRSRRKQYRQHSLEKPQVYIVQDKIPKQGYYIVKQKRPEPDRANEVQEDQLDRRNEQQKEYRNCKDLGEATTSNLNREGMGKAKSDSCDRIHKLLEIPLIQHILMEAMLNNDLGRAKEQKPLKFLVREVLPDYTELDDLDKPESVRCIKNYLKKRRRRHSTYQIANSKAKRKVDSASQQFKDIMDFIVKNKTFDDSYTFVPIVFATVTPILPNEPSEKDSVPTEINTNTQSSTTSLVQESTGTESDTNTPTTGTESDTTTPTTSSATGTSTGTSEDQVTTPPTESSSSQTSTILQTTCYAITTSSVEGQSTSTGSEATSGPAHGHSTVLQAIINFEGVASSNTTGSSDDMNFHVPQIKASGKNAVTAINSPSNKPAADEKNLVQELNFHVPQLRRSFMEIMNRQQTGSAKRHYREKKEASEESKSSSSQDSTKTTACQDCTTSGSTSTSIACSEQDTTTGSADAGATGSTSSTEATGSTALESTPSSSSADGDSTAEPNPSNSNMIPGVLIYPKPKTKQKRFAFDLPIIDDPILEPKYTNNEMFKGTTSEFFDPNRYKKFIDFMPFRKLKKDVSHDCKNKTDEILDVLSNINADGIGDNISPVTFENENMEGKTGVTNDNTTSTAPDLASDSQQTGMAQQSPSDTSGNLDFNMISNGDNAMTQQITSSINSPDEIAPATSSKNDLVNEPTEESVMNTATGSISGTCQESQTPREPSDALTTPVGNIKSRSISYNVTLNGISLTVESIPNIQTTQPTSVDSFGAKDGLVFSKKFPYNDHKEIEVSVKLKRLESDLKLVDEVQNILNGINDISHKINKREVAGYGQNAQVADCDETTPVFELHLKVQTKDNKDVQKEIVGLGKILDWKAKQPKDECRLKRRAKYRRKKKRRKKFYKHVPRNRRFLAQDTQNFQ